MSNQSAQAQTVANALSGEKAFETVRFAITGNENADALAGIQAVLEKIPLNRNSPIPHARYAAMLLKYLADVYAAEASALEEQAKKQQQIGGMIPGGILDPSYPAPSYTPPYAHPPYSHEYTTTGGTAGLGYTAPKITGEDALDRLNSMLVEEEKKRAAILRDLMKNNPPV